MMRCPKGKHCDVKDCPKSGHDKCPFPKTCSGCTPIPIATILAASADEFSGGGGGKVTKECNRGIHCPYLKNGSCKKDHTICLNGEKCTICLPKPVAAVLPVAVAKEHSGGGGGEFIAPVPKECTRRIHCTKKNCTGEGHGVGCPYGDNCTICLPKPVTATAAVVPVAVAKEHSGGGGGQFIEPAIKVCPRGIHCAYEKDGTCKKNHTGCPYGDNCTICKKPPVAAATAAVVPVAVAKEHSGGGGGNPDPIPSLTKFSFNKNVPEFIPGIPYMIDVCNEEEEDNDSCLEIDEQEEDDVNVSDNGIDPDIDYTNVPEYLLKEDNDSCLEIDEEEYSDILPDDDKYSDADPDLWFPEHQNCQCCQGRVFSGCACGSQRCQCTYKK